MVRMDGEKMSKSLGNMVFVRDLLRSYSPDAIRLYLLGHHYREVWEWNAKDLDAAATLAADLATQARAPDRDSEIPTIDFRAALEADLNTPAAINTLPKFAGAPLRSFAAVLGLTLA